MKRAGVITAIVLLCVAALLSAAAIMSVLAGFAAGYGLHGAFWQGPDHPLTAQAVALIRAFRRNVFWLALGCGAVLMAFAWVVVFLVRRVVLRTAATPPLVRLVQLAFALTLFVVPFHLVCAHVLWLASSSAWIYEAPQFVAALVGFWATAARWRHSYQVAIVMAATLCIACFAAFPTTGYGVLLPAIGWVLVLVVLIANSDVYAYFHDHPAIRADSGREAVRGP